MTAGQHPVGLVYHDNLQCVQGGEVGVAAGNKLPQAAYEGGGGGEMGRGGGGQSGVETRLRSNNNIQLRV